MRELISLLLVPEAPRVRGRPVVALRVTLEQPSPIWHDCRLDDMTCYGPGEADTRVNPTQSQSGEKWAKELSELPAEKRAVMKMLRSAQQLRTVGTPSGHSASSSAESIFSLSYDEVVVGVTSDCNPSLDLADYTGPSSLPGVGPDLSSASGQWIQSAQGDTDEQRLELNTGIQKLSVT